MTTIDNLRVKIFADGADKAGILELYAKPYIQGSTTNPTLMQQAGIEDYAVFARKVWPGSPTGPFPSRSSPTSSTRWSGRRECRFLGPERLRQDPRDEHPT